MVRSTHFTEFYFKELYGAQTQVESAYPRKTDQFTSKNVLISSWKIGTHSTGWTEVEYNNPYETDPQRPGFDCRAKFAVQGQGFQGLFANTVNLPRCYDGKIIFY